MGCCALVAQAAIGAAGEKEDCSAYGTDAAGAVGVVAADEQLVRRIYII